MNSYVEIRCDLPNDPRVKRIASTLNAPVDHVCGALARFWSAAYERGKRRGRDTVIPHYTRAMFESECALPGVVDALAAVEWCAESPDGSLVMPRGKDRFDKLKRERVREYEANRKRRYRAEHLSQLRPAVSGTVPRKQQQSSSSSAAASKPEAESEAAVASKRADAAAAAAAPDCSASLSAAALLPENRERLTVLRMMGLTGAVLDAFAVKPQLDPAWLRDLGRRGLKAKARAGWFRNAITDHLSTYGNGAGQ